MKYLKRPLLATALFLQALTLPTLALPTVAAAEEVSAEDKAAARDLAVEGIKLAQEGNCEKAVDKLKRADKLFHAPTILTWVGQCQIQLGHYVEGTETLNRVVREELAADAPAAYVTAQTKARELIESAKPKIGKLTIEVTPADLEGVSVRVDDKEISAAMIGAPKPTDPGEHTVTVTAPGYRTASAKVTLDPGGQESVSLKLEVDPSGAQTDTAGTAESGERKTNWVGWATVGAGGAFLATGGVMGILAMQKKNDLDCPGNVCTGEEADQLKSTRLNATLSTVFFGVGGAAVVTGVVLLVTGTPGSSAKETATVGAFKDVRPLVGIGSLGLSGSF